MGNCSKLQDGDWSQLPVDPEGAAPRRCSIRRGRRTGRLLWSWEILWHMLEFHHLPTKGVEMVQVVEIITEFKADGFINVGRGTRA